MNNLLKTTLIIAVSSGVSTLLLNKLYKANPGLFSFIDKIPERWKGKWFVRWIVLLLLMIMFSIIVVSGGLNDTIGTIIIGVFISLTDFILMKPKKIK